MNLNKLLCTLLLVLSTTTVFGDDVIIMGTHTRTNMSGDDLAMMKGDVCKSISTAEKLGQRVHLLTPSIRCGSKSYVGQCGGRECTKAEYGQQMKTIAAQIPSNQKSNLLIQTVGHGEIGSRPSQNALLINGKESLSADDLAKIINTSGITSKVEHIRSLYFQCYSGGFHTVASKIMPAGKMCGVSQSQHTNTARPVGIETEKLGGSAFITGMWQELDKTKGKASLTQGFENAGKLALEADKYNHPTSDWRSGSEYQMLEALHQAEFNPNGTEQSGVISPSTSDDTGFNLTHWTNDSKLELRLQKDTQKALHEREDFDRYARAIAEDNDSFTSYFTGDKPISHKVHAIQCDPVATHGTELNNLSKEMQAIEHSALVSGDPEIATLIKDVKARHQVSLEKMASLESRYRQEYKRFVDDLNRLVKASEDIMIKLKSPGTKLSDAQEAALLKRYGEIEVEMKALKDKHTFPTLKEMALIQRDAERTTNLLYTMRSKKVSLEQKRSIAAAYNCENSPIFLNGTK